MISRWINAYQLALTAVGLASFSVFGNQAYGQAVTPLPYDPSMILDPNVGVRQGIQRFGRQLKVDPEYGTGYTYRVMPNQNDAIPLGSNVRTVVAGRGAAGAQGLPLQQHPFLSTGGMRSTAQAVPLDDQLGASAVSAAQGLYVPLAEVVTSRPPKGKKFTGYATAQLFHQPLIQVKVRVVEVSRSDSLQVGTILDYVGDASEDDSLVTLNNINNNGRKTSAATRFGNLVSAAGIDPDAIPPNDITDVVGTGALVNITSEHINFLTSLLATQFEADVITAPEVVTLNGQNVEFVAGAKIPFALGLNTVQGDSKNEQTFFYKHVGAYVSVTPRIVNWGVHGEGRGQAAIQATEVNDWNGLVDWMLDPSEFRLRKPSPQETASKAPIPPTKEELTRFSRREGVRPLPYEMRRRILYELSQYPPNQLRQKIALYSELRQARNIDGQIDPILIIPPGAHGCDWNPEDCTIDLEVVVRLSDAGLSNQTITLNRGQENETAEAAAREDDIRAVANVLQVKSGYGVVMAGLIGESDLEDVEKVPVLGDIPVVGYLFRSKVTSRTKSETLVFIEAQVLQHPDDARHESTQDFALGKPYVSGELLGNPLECGMHRVGFGSYLPPHSREETVFWERTARKVQKAHTHIDDILE